MRSLPLDLKSCPDCGGPLAREFTLRASGLGPGDVVQLCAEARMAPLLPKNCLFACGAPLPDTAARLTAELMAVRAFVDAMADTAGVPA